MSPEQIWEWFKTNKDYVDPLLALVTTVLWGVYVFFTIKTFREIRRQTELQSEAFLVVASQITQDTKEAVDRVTSKAKGLWEKWNRIIRNVPDVVCPENYLVLRLQNRGKCDIVSWRIRLNVAVEPLQYLKSTQNVTGETVSWLVESQGQKDILAPDHSTSVCVLKCGVFPKAEMTWDLDYTDIRNKKYSRFGGDFKGEDNNAYSNPKAPNIS
jgi:hypothetical protein